MKLKSLEIQGFKSFPDRTLLEFDQGFTAVVGPNGCGKSNISDAIRWVLGEQSTKNLRGSKMEDVVFLGSKDRKSQGFAKVEITLKNLDRAMNLDCDEIKVGRKFYRDGYGEYFINGKSVALKEVLKLFMDTGLSKEGYALIGQGKIEQIVSAKSHDRRKIFDEAAGITKYKYRKSEAQKNLDRAQDNLLRLNDVLSEVKRQVDPLKTQAKKAKTFRDYSNLKKELELSIWDFELERIKSSLKSKQDDLFLQTKRYEDLSSELEETAKKLGENFNEIQNLTLKIERTRELKTASLKKEAELNTAIAVVQGEIKHSNDTIATLLAEMKMIKSSKSNINSKIEQMQVEVKNLKNQKEVALKSKETAINNLKASLYKSSKAMALQEKLKEELDKLVTEQTNLMAKIEIINNKIAMQKESDLQIDSRKTALLDEQKTLELKKEQNLEKLDNLAIQKGNLDNMQKGYALKLKSRKQKLDNTQEQLFTLRQNALKCEQSLKILKELERSQKGLSKGTASVLKAAQKGLLSGVLGGVSQLLKVKSEYALAIETALLSAIQNIVVKDEQAAKRAIEYLKQSKGGRATFLPISSVSPKPPLLGLDGEKGFLGTALELTSYDNAYKNIFSNLLGKVAVVDNLDSAIQMGKKHNYSFKIVTKDGQLVGVGGSFTGGSRQNNSGILTRKSEIDKNMALLKNINEKQNDVKSSILEIELEIEKLNAQSDGLKGELITLREDEIKTLSELKSQEERAAGLSQSLLDLKSNLLKSKEQAKILINESLSVNERHSDINGKITRLKDQLNEAATKAKEFSDNQKKVELKSIEFDKQLIKFDEQLKNTQRLIDDLRSQKEESSQKKETLDFRILEARKQIEQKTKLLELNQKDTDREKDNQIRLDKSIETLIAGKNELEKQRRLKSSEEKEKFEAKERFAGEISKLKEQIKAIEEQKENIIKQMWESYELGPKGAKEYAKKQDDINALRASLASLKSKIRGLGNVNLSAIEEYEELKKRYDFLCDQFKDAQSSKLKLNRLIRDLDRSMERMFKDAFAKINANFKKIFKELFGGGHANLSLSDEQNLLESGIDIEVSPPGKIIKNLSALSGGEKSFIAIAIYFSIMSVNPAPFCVLDEIEAALDDVNVDKFASYLKKIDHKTQFIVITHRRGTMLKADALYGVTMQEEGVSKLLKLDAQSKKTKEYTN